MKRSVLIYALAWGLLGAVLVVLSNVVFTQPNVSDDAYTGWELVGYLGLFLLFGVGGALNAQRGHPLLSGAVGGAAAALLIMGMVMLTFAVVDNLFLDTVSRQIDKITAFHDQTTYTNMRDFINAGLLQGALAVLPVCVLLGGGLGAVGALVRNRLTPPGDRSSMAAA